MLHYGKQLVNANVSAMYPDMLYIVETDEKISFYTNIKTEFNAQDLSHFVVPPTCSQQVIIALIISCHIENACYITYF